MDCLTVSTKYGVMLTNSTFKQDLLHCGKSANENVSLFHAEYAVGSLSHTNF